MSQHHIKPGGGGFKVFMTHHNEGGGAVYRVENYYGYSVLWGSFDDVKAKVVDWLAKSEGHVCSEKCGQWEHIRRN